MGTTKAWAATIAVVAGTTATGSSNASRAIVTDNNGTACPKALVTTAYAPEGLLRAVRREVPRVYNNVQTQGGKLRLSAATYRIDALSSLQQTVPPLAGALAYRRLAAKRCGSNIAERSWVVIIDIPGAQTVRAARGVALFARTASRWVLWYRVR